MHNDAEDAELAAQARLAAAVEAEARAAAREALKLTEEIQAALAAGATARLWYSTPVALTIRFPPA